jgi:CheY-like chemotaxis protein
MEKLKFLIVDDDPINNKLCRHILKSTIPDVQIIDFTLPSAGIEHLRTAELEADKNNPVILLLDLNMPIISGWDFLDIFDKMDDSIRGNYKIFILSSSIDERDLQRANKNQHVSGYISKPLTKDKVISVLTNLKKSDN